jgi:hypothetical protein
VLDRCIGQSSRELRVALRLFDESDTAPHKVRAGAQVTLASVRSIGRSRRREGFR